MRDNTQGAHRMGCSSDATGPEAEQAIHHFRGFMYYDAFVTPTKELLYKALDHIHAKPDQFSMGVWATTPSCSAAPYDLMLNPTCDTIMCLAGWVIHEAGVAGFEDVSFSETALKALGVYGDEELSEAFREVFYINPEAVKTPEDLVSVLIDKGILSKGEYTYGE